MMGAKGNQFWKRIDVKDLGRNPKFKTPEDLWDSVSKYFEHCDENPIETEKTSVSDKGTYYNTEELRIPYTWKGLYVFLCVCSLDHYKTKDAFSAILTHIGNVIFNQKFVGASIGLFNASIISKDLGLIEKTQNKTDLSLSDGSIPIDAWLKEQLKGDKDSE